MANAGIDRARWPQRKRLKLANRIILVVGNRQPRAPGLGGSGPILGMAYPSRLRATSRARNWRANWRTTHAEWEYVGEDGDGYLSYCSGHYDGPSLGVF